MADAPKPITSPPAQPWQPYDACAPGAAEDQTAPTTIYDAAGSTSGSEPWVKVQEAGACSMEGETAGGDWPGDGTSDGGAWKQT
jgi:hypothetical protein